GGALRRGLPQRRPRDLNVCGISGALTPVDGRTHALVAEQLELLDHRGPDARGVFEAPDALVAQNRLSIIDLVGGDPPIMDESGTVGVALNGEIYNFRELRDMLVTEGHRFRTRGDTEVIAHLAEEREPLELARSLDGMFAFA